MRWMIVVLLVFIAGCSAKSSNRNDGVVRITYPDGGTYESKSRGAVFIETAPASAGESLAQVSHAGASSRLAGTHKPDPVNWAAKNTGWLYIIGGLSLVGGAVVAFALKQRLAGGAISLAGGVLCVAPSVMGQLGIMLVVSLGILLAGGAAWAAVTVWRSQEAKRRSKAAASEIKAGLENEDSAMVRAGVALARAANPALDKGFEAIR